MSKKVVFMPLLGGLGNQLFQLAAALSISNGREILLISNLGNQRRNSENYPEIQSLILPEHVSFDRKFKEHRFCTIIFNRLLTYNNKNRLFRLFLHFFAKVLFSIHFTKTVKLHTSNGVGYDDWTLQDQNEVGIGYFQSYIWSDNSEVLALMHQLKPRVVSQRFLELKSQMQKSTSLVIHMRLGDYLNEPGIGVLGREYYLNALKAIGDQNQEYWVFSDQPDVAKNLLPNAISDNCVFIQPSELSTIETWELMRHGKRYIISNSTFSWWSARLSYTENPDVVAPTPWFAALPDPKSIIPVLWKEIPRL